MFCYNFVSQFFSKRTILFSTNLILSLAAFHLNSRPIGFVQPNMYLCANHFILPNFESQQWNADDSISSKFKQHSEYVARMRDEYLKMLQCGKYLPNKWKKEGLLPKVGDIIFISRGVNKISKLGILEYAKVINISDDKRLITALVCRSKSGDIKTVEADSRNCKLIYRPNDNDV